jgi:hypothetical protein
MAELHEEYLAEVFGGRKTRGSGSQWQDQGDGHNNRLTTEFAFGWDGKSTLGKGITVDRAMLEKIREQAGGERPAIGLRFYGTEDLKQVDEDWVAITAADLAELLEAARWSVAEVGQAIAAARQSWEQEQVGTQVGPDSWFPDPPRPGPVPVQPPSSPVPVLSGPYPVQLLPVPPHELWPCLVVDGRHDEGDAGSITSRGYWIADDGTVTDRSVSSVRYDRGMGELRLYVDDVRVIRGELYIDGTLRVRVGGPQLTVS